MNPFLSRELATEHIRDLREQAVRDLRTHPEPRADQSDATRRLTVRRFAERDIDGIRLLATLDSKPMPTGAVLVAEEAGEVIAALPLDGGKVLADPFKPTAHVVAMLKLRARQLSAEASETTVRRSRLHMPRGRFAA